MFSNASAYIFPPSGEGEFHQRLERFKVPDFQASPAPALRPTDPSPRACSNSVSDIQQKLQCSTTPSSQQASRIREVGSRAQPVLQGSVTMKLLDVKIHLNTAKQNILLIINITHGVSELLRKQL